MIARRLLLRGLVLVLLFPHLAEKLIEHVVLGLLLVWIGWHHGHSPPARH